MQGTVIESKCKTPPIGSGRRQHMASGYHYVTHSYDSAMVLLLWPHWLSGGTAANLPHLLSSQELNKPALRDDERHFCLSLQAAEFPCLHLVFDRARPASLRLFFDKARPATRPHALATERSTKAQVLGIRARVSATRCSAFRPTTPRHGSSDGIPAGTTTV